MIIKEGHLPACFYFILSGTGQQVYYSVKYNTDYETFLTVQVVRRGSERSELLEAGQTFGVS